MRCLLAAAFPRASELAQTILKQGRVVRAGHCREPNRVHFTYRAISQTIVRKVTCQRTPSSTVLRRQHSLRNIRDEPASGLPRG